MSRYALRQSRSDPTSDVQLLRAGAALQFNGVDRHANALRGYVVAQVGPFKSEGRGEFDRQSLDAIVQLGNTATRGLRAHFGHETMCSDALGSFLGRASSFRLSTTVNAAGDRVECVRGDLQFDSTALKPSPKGGQRPLGFYVMELAENDPDAISSSLVLQVRKEYRLNTDGTRKRDADGEDLPPLWRPRRLMASDIVATGDAVDGLLSVDGLDGLRDKHLFQGSAILDRLLADGRLGDLSRHELRARLTGWVDRFLDSRFGPEERVSDVRMLEVRQRQREREAGIY